MPEQSRLGPARVGPKRAGAGEETLVATVGHNPLGDPRVHNADPQLNADAPIAAIDAVYDVIVITDARGTIEYVNPAFTRCTGYAAHEAIGRNPRFLKSGG